VATGGFWIKFWVVNWSWCHFDTDRGTWGARVSEVKCPNESVLTDARSLIKIVEGDLCINVQGDEQNQDIKALTDLVACFQDASVQIANALCKFKKCSGTQGNPIWSRSNRINSTMHFIFSRARIPFDRMAWPILTIGKHIGIYGYRREVLFGIHENSEKSALEKIEMPRAA